jgi:predicted dehydrogenase
VSGWRGEEEQGGALLEGGIHWIDLLAHLGPPVRSLRGYRARPDQGPERSTQVVVEYADGSVGTLTHSWEAPSVAGGLQLSRISGREGSIVFESNGLFVLVLGRERRLILPGLRDLAGYRGMFGDFLQALRGGGEPLMTLERARVGATLVESARGGDRGRDASAGSAPAVAP